MPHGRRFRLPAFTRTTKEIRMSEPNEPQEPDAYTAAPPTQSHAQDEED